MYSIQNVSGGLLVCSLKDPSKTLRLNNKETTTISDKEVTPYLENLAVKGYIKLKRSDDTSKMSKAVKKVDVTADENKEKEV